MRSVWHYGAKRFLSADRFLRCELRNVRLACASRRLSSEGSYLSTRKSESAKLRDEDALISQLLLDTQRATRRVNAHASILFEPNGGIERAASHRDWSSEYIRSQDGHLFCPPHGKVQDAVIQRDGYRTVRLEQLQLRRAADQDLAPTRQSDSRLSGANNHAAAARQSVRTTSLGERRIGRKLYRKILSINQTDDLRQPLRGNSARGNGPDAQAETNAKQATGAREHYRGVG